MSQARVRTRTVPLFLGCLDEAARKRLSRKLGVALPSSATEGPALLLPLSLIPKVTLEVARQLGDPELGVRLAERAPPGLYGWVELLARSAPTLRQGITLLGRYGSILEDGSVVSVGHEDSNLVFNLIVPGVPEAFGRQVNELCLCYLVRAIREILRWPDWAPRQLRFAHRAPRGQRRLRAFLATDDLLYGQGRNALVLDPEVLDAPSWNSAPDAGLLSMLEDGARRLLTAGPRDTQAELRRQIGAQLRTRTCTLAHVARALKLSPRTLQRQLAAEQLSFSALVEDCRRRIAEEELGAGEVSTAELARRLGYRSTQAFSHAFKRWTGEPPRAYLQRRRR